MCWGARLPAAQCCLATRCVCGWVGTHVRKLPRCCRSTAVQADRARAQPLHNVQPPRVRLRHLAASAAPDLACLSALPHPPLPPAADPLCQARPHGDLQKAHRLHLRVWPQVCGLPRALRRRHDPPQVRAGAGRRCEGWNWGLLRLTGVPVRGRGRGGGRGVINRCPALHPCSHAHPFCNFCNCLPRRHIKGVSSDVEYLNSRDATIMGSRNGHAPIYMWWVGWVGGQGASTLCGAGCRCTAAGSSRPHDQWGPAVAWRPAPPPRMCPPLTCLPTIGPSSSLRSLPHLPRYTFTRKGYEGLRKDVEKCLRNAHLLKVGRHRLGGTGGRLLGCTERGQVTAERCSQGASQAGPAAGLLPVYTCTCPPAVCCTLLHSAWSCQARPHPSACARPCLPTYACRPCLRAPA